MIDATTAIDELIKHEALLVHCAGLAKMVGNEKTNQMKYLERLTNAAGGELELACSTVQRGDWTSALEIRNYTGPCGLILRPVGNVSITYAWPKDAGSSIGDRGRRIVRPEAREFPLDRAIASRPRDKYNEIGVLGFKVVGVFMDQVEFEYSVPDCQVNERLRELGNPEPDHPDFLKAFAAKVSASDVRDTFPDLDLFFMHQGVLHWKVRNGRPASGLVPLDYVYGR